MLKSLQLPAKLNEIMETQRDEIGRLNDILDGLNGQGLKSTGEAP